MSWSYSPSIPTAKDQVRLLVGDTDTTDQLLQDEEITFLIAQRADTPSAAADAAEVLAARYARQVDTTNGVLAVKAGDRRTHFAELAAELRSRASILAGATMTTGGTSVAEKISHQTNSDEVQPFFRRGGDDYPGASPNPEDLTDIVR